MITAAGISDSPAFLALITGVLGLFGGGGVIALMKVKPERHKIVIDAAQGAVIVQSGVIESLNAEVGRLRARLVECEQLVESAGRRVARLENEIKQAGLEIPEGAEGV